MRRTLISVMMVLCLSSLFARVTLVVETEGKSPSYALMAGVAEYVAESSLLPRMGGEGVLSLYISDLLETDPNALSALLLFSYGERTLQLYLSADAKDSKHLEKVLKERLASMLLYDGMVLFEAETSPCIDYTYSYGYASLVPLRKGDLYKGLDAEQNRWATVVVQRTFESDDPVSLLVGTGGKKLLPGMRLEKQAGKSLSLFLSGTPVSGAPFSIGGLYSQQIGLYPFTLVLGAGSDITASSLTTVYAQAGLAVNLPLSMIFGLNSGFWRNSSLAVRCTLDFGYVVSEEELLYGSSAVFTYRYHIGGVGLDVGLGNKRRAPEFTGASSGLFMQLGLAYTW